MTDKNNEINNEIIDLSGVFLRGPSPGVIAGSGSISYSNMDEAEMREGFQELFSGEEVPEMLDMKPLLDTPLSPDRETRNKILEDIRKSRDEEYYNGKPITGVRPIPPPKTEPPLSQRPKPIINRKGRVKRAFDFDD